MERIAAAAARRPALRRITGYAAAALGLALACVLAWPARWTGDRNIHTIIDIIAVNAAANAGMLALMRYRNQKDDTFLFIGCGFAGTAVLEAYHGIVTSSYFAEFYAMPQTMQNWSGFAEELFLSLALFLSWADWFLSRRDARPEPVSVALVCTAFAALVVGCLAFVTLLPMSPDVAPKVPPGDRELAELLLVATTAGYLAKGKWRSDPFEHWLILSLIALTASDVLRSFATHAYDARFMTAHGLKLAGYFCALTGIVLSMNRLTRLSAREAVIIEDIATGAFIEINERLCTLLGYGRNEMLRLDFPALSAGPAPTDAAALKRLLDEAAASGAPRLFDWPLRAKDGRVLWAEISLSRGTFEGAQDCLVATLHDISERKEAERELHRRDQILHAVTLAAAELAAPPLAEKMPAALEIVGKALGVSRVMVIRDPLKPPLKLVLAASWQSPEVALDFDAEFAKIEDHAALLNWFAPIASGKAQVTLARTAAPAVRDLLSRIGAKSVLLVPIFADAALWGMIGIDDCTAEREWLASEIDTLATLAEVIGSIVERERALVSRDEREEEFRAIFDAAGDGIFVIDPGTAKLLEVNPQGCALFGYARAELIGRAAEDLAPGVTPQLLADRIAASKRGGAEISERQVTAKDGRRFWTEISLRATHYRSREVALASVRDVTERKEAVEKIAQMARVDPLTGLPNRREFVEVLEREIARCEREGGSTAVLYLDLDHFKDVNDTLGHPVGDQLLVAVGRRLGSVLRASDSLARFGGDEFAVLATALHDADDAAVLAAKIVAAVATPFMIEGNEIRSGVSIGIAIAAGAGGAETVLSYADVALYRAKAEGRGVYSFFTEAMDQSVRKRVALATELRQGIERDELFLVYQPQVEMETGRILGVEALVRWRHPQRGVLGPNEFIPLAEESGSVVALGKWVLREACRQARRWLDAGVAPGSIAVNVSAVQFKTPLELERDIFAILAETGTPASLLVLELTETVLMEVWREHGETLERLHGRGIRIAIDDFGTGYSSLDYLHRYPVDHIKIAQIFVADPKTDPAAMAIVKAAINLARDLNLGVIVEGVESAAQAQQLRAWGCGEAQGYHYARPLPAEAMTKLLHVGRIATDELAAAPA